MPIRLFASILFSLMIVISSSGVLQTKHRIGVHTHQSSPPDSAKTAEISMTFAKGGHATTGHRKIKSHAIPVAAKHKRPAREHAMEHCCKKGAMQTNCALMPLCIGDELLEPTRFDEIKSIRFALKSKFLPSIVLAPPRSPPRLA